MSDNNSMNNTGSCIQNSDGNYYKNGVPCQPTLLEKTGISTYLPNMWPFNGGKKGTVKRGGGVRGYTDLNSASTASRFSGGRTAQPHQWTGGKRRRRTKKGKSSLSEKS